MKTQIFAANAKDQFAAQMMLDTNPAGIFVGKTKEGFVVLCQERDFIWFIDETQLDEVYKLAKAEYRKSQPPQSEDHGG